MEDGRCLATNQRHSESIIQKLTEKSISKYTNKEFNCTNFILINYFF